MALFKNKIRDIEQSEDVEVNNVSKVASDKLVDIIKDISGAREKVVRKVPDNVILFSNASGGTGVSTIVANTAFSMVQKKLNVIVIDLNIMCPQQHMYLGIEQNLDKTDDLVSFLLGKSELNLSINSQKAIHLLYASNRSLSDEINCNERLAVENFKILLEKLQQYYDVILIDCPMRIDNLLANTALYLADSIYLVWDEGTASVVNTEKIRRNMALSGIDSFTKIKVIVNKRTSVDFSDFALNKMGIDLVEVLPFTMDVISAGLKGRIFCEKGNSTSKNSAIFSRNISRMTNTILKCAGYIE